ncbi:HlyD family efflux transporter periplasmic adaptor subunit [Cytophaga hutchinsonii]|nr:HlyD family efflux transporter periplasmic adaptor subunit [Cytophaga hutchinsonii]
MKRLLNKNNSIYLFMLGIILTSLACNNKQTELHVHASAEMSNEAKIYTCPMHPEIIRNKPGKCPICGMDLVEKGAIMQNLGELSIDDVIEPVNQTVIGKAKTITPLNKKMLSQIESSGYITYNPKNTSSVSSRFDGRIDKLYIKYNFQEVTKGQKIMDVYSPELVTAQQNYIFLLNNKEDDPSLLQATKQRLILLGMNEAQLLQLEKTRKPEYLVSIYAPVSGHIHQMSDVTELTMPTMPMNGDKTGNSMNTSATEFNIREGVYIKKGEPVFNIISLSQVWVILKVYPQDISTIKIGQPVTIISEVAPDNAINAKISFIEPILDADSKFASVRVYLDKSDHHIFKIGSLVNAIISTDGQDGLWIPTSATLNLGNGNSIVFKKEGNNFRASAITVANRVDNEINIISGLSAHDTIALNAWYMVDSESFVLTK